MFFSHHPRSLGAVLVVAAATLSLFPLATMVPNEIQQPGTQPGEVSGLEAVSRCDNCHGGYDPAVEPAQGWRGSLMAHAIRDPLLWAALAVTEQDFDGAGDLCLRCHTPSGWLAGRSTPTDGSALAASDSDGVSCDLCHRLVTPNDSEYSGAQFPPYLAHSGGSAPESYLGGGMYVMWDGSEKHGPYADPVARHPFLQSSFSRSSELCGTCHDVSNPLVGDLAHNNGAQTPLPAGSFSGVPGDPVSTKAAFNNFPHQYGVVERTFSEHQASAFPGLRVADYAALPAELQGGAIEHAYQSALAAGQGGDYEDGTPRYFTCQSCHLRPAVGKGCNKSDAPLRRDLPLHDLAGGNYWMPAAILHLDSLGKLRLGGGLTGGEVTALQEGAQRARDNLREAAALEIQGNLLRVINRTGHKLISGYPEGRRMWLRSRWYDAQGALLREDGAYDWITVDLNGTPTQVRSLLDLQDPEARVYEVHAGLTQEWANQLLGLGFSPALPLAYDRLTGGVALTLGDLAARPAGSAEESFHFALNNVLLLDTRIPPYGMRYDDAVARNIVPVPADQYGNPGPGASYRHWDERQLHPPAGAATASIELLYQPTSWEYIQFLYLANRGTNAFLAATGSDLLDAWLATGMAEPEVMAAVTWSKPPLLLSTSGLVAGASATLTVDGATPQGVVGFAYSLAGAGTTLVNVPGCGVVAAGVLQPAILGLEAASLGGTATFSGAVPSGSTGARVWLQGMDLASCTLSNVLLEIIG